MSGTYSVGYGYRSEIPTGIDFHDIMLMPRDSLVNSRKEVNLLINDSVLSHKPYVPIVAANMDTIGTFSMARSLSKHRLITCIHKHYTAKQWFEFVEACVSEFGDSSQNPDSPIWYVVPSFGIKDEDLAKCKEILRIEAIRAICIDVANAYTEKARQAVKEYRAIIKETGRHINIVYGNVVSEPYIEYNYDENNQRTVIWKVGIGSGKQCLTRAKTGIGCPQASAIIKCLGYQGQFDTGEYNKVMSDGGCRTSGDIVKAFAVGSEYVMIGSMLAGHDECEGRVFELKGQKMMTHYGMSSQTAMEKYSGGMKGYRASEGYEALVQYKGSVENTIIDILGGVRSACTYLNANSIQGIRGADFTIVRTPRDNTV